MMLALLCFSYPGSAPVLREADACRGDEHPRAGASAVQGISSQYDWKIRWLARRTCKGGEAMVSTQALVAIHAHHHGQVRGADLSPRSRMFEGRFGRLFRTLPAVSALATHTWANSSITI